MIRKQRPIEDRFWEKVDIRSADECWLWKASGKTYGFFRLGRRRDGSIEAHRFSLELKLGRKLLPKEWSCHKCDNPKCVNPAHLFLGNAKSNTRDMLKKNRAKTKLKKDQVEWLRKTYWDDGRATIKQLASQLNVSSRLVMLILKGSAWPEAGGPTVSNFDMRKYRNGGVYWPRRKA
jgi:hypothetical protein